ncbi:MAG TPA: class I SAM-dependent methyltransferase [Myxococcales bacterium]|nr:class I SAM-dependent methyltransferase [Myxococcales bacterium]
MIRDLFYRAVIKAQRLSARTDGWPPKLTGRGIEIGAHGNPIPGIEPFYVDRFREFAGAKCPAHVLSDGAALPFRDSSLDYVASSHLLEHLPDPAGAIVEWYRAVKPGGIIYIVVPDRRLTFDRHRPRTKVSHLMEDFERKTGPSDPTHIDDFFDHLDWKRFDPSLKAEDVPAFRELHREQDLQAAREGRMVSIHFHVFEKPDLIALLEALREHPKALLRYELVEERTFFPPDAGNGFLVAIRSKKPEPKT